MKRLIIILLFLANGLFAQEFLPGKDYSNWAFGHNCYITFNTPDGIPVSVSSSEMETSEGCATVSDRFGNLLFYTNGNKVYNRNHKLMLNGDSLGGHYSSAQSCIAIRKASEDGKYYLFTMDATESLFEHGLAYSIIDVNYLNGLGRVEKKNIQLLYGITERMAAVKHANRTDNWILTHNNENKFFAYLIGDDFIDSPVISKIEKDIYTNYSTTIKFSGDGSRFCTDYFGRIDMFNFNRKTGHVTHDYSIVKDSLKYLYGIEFSTGGRFLYISDFEHIYRYDLLSGDPEEIEDSEIIIADGNYGALQIGPDGRIYCSKVNAHSLDAISNPDSKNNYKFHHNFVDLGENYALLGLPATIYGKYRETLSISYSSPVCLGDTISLASDEIRYADSLKWISPSNIIFTTDAVEKFSAEDTDNGWWKLNIFIGGHVLSDSVFVEVHDPGDLELNPSGEIITCPNDTLMATVRDGFSQYFWNGVTGSNSMMIDRPGKYIIEAHDEYGCITRDSLVVKYEKSVLNLDDKIVDLGEICTESVLESAFNYRNMTNGSITVDTMFLAHNKEINLVNTVNLPFILDYGDWILQRIRFSPEVVGNSYDTLVIRTSHPCQIEYRLPCVARGLPVPSKVSLPNVTAEIGSSDYKVPLVADLNCFEDKILELDYEAEIIFDPYVFYFQELTNGTLIDEYIDGQMKVIVIRDSGLFLGERPAVINNLKGLVLMSDNANSPLIISRFEWTNHDVDVEIRNGILQTRGCMQNLQGLQYFEPPSVSPNPTSDKATLNNCKGARVDIFDICGRKVMTVMPQSDEVDIDFEELSPGVYNCRIDFDGYKVNELIRIIK